MENAQVVVAKSMLTDDACIATVLVGVTQVGRGEGRKQIFKICAVLIWPQSGSATSVPIGPSQVPQNPHQSSPCFALHVSSGAGA